MSVLAVDRFGDSAEAAYGIFDGDRNEEVPRLLQCTMGDVLSEELQHSSMDSVYMSNTFLTSHRYVATHTQACSFVEADRVLTQLVMNEIKMSNL